MLVNHREQGLSYPLPFHFSTSSVGVLIISGDALGVYFNVTESSGAAPAQVEFFDGMDSKGTSLGVINLAAGTSVQDNWGPYGVYCTRGLFMNVNSGAVFGTVGFVDL